MLRHRIFTTAFAKVYPMYVQKTERKNRSQQEVDQIICWLSAQGSASRALALSSAGMQCAIYVVIRRACPASLTGRARHRAAH